MLIKFPILITEDLLEIAIYLAIFERADELKSWITISVVPSVLFSQLDGKNHLKDLSAFLPSGYPGYQWLHKHVCWRVHKHDISEDRCEQRW